MFDTLYGTLKRMLFPVWNRRLPGIVAGGRLAETSGMSASDAYAEGYRTAYFDAISDLVEAGLVHTPAPALHREMSFIQVSDEVH